MNILQALEMNGLSAKMLSEDTLFMVFQDNKGTIYEK